MAAERFEVAIPEERLDDLRRRLRTVHWPRDFANDDWRYGTNARTCARLRTTGCTPTTGARKRRRSTRWSTTESALTASPFISSTRAGVGQHLCRSS